MKIVNNIMLHTNHLIILEAFRLAALSARGEGEAAGPMRPRAQAADHRT